MLAVALVAAVLVAVGIGAVAIAPTEVVAVLADRLGLRLPWAYTEQQETVLTAIRIPRVLASGLVGAAWAAAGVAMQGLYRTPLADPALIGVGAGAALGAVLGTALAIDLGLAASLAGTLLIAAGAGVAAFLAAMALHRVATASGRVVVATMLLAGVALSAFLAAATGLLVAADRSTELGSVSFWTLGSFSGAVGTDVVVATITLIPALVILARLGPRLDALALGESAAGHLGVDVGRLALLVTLILAVLAGVAVAVAGVIAFVGLMVPSLARLYVGPSHRVVTIASALLGAILLVVIDVLARSLLAPVELSIGMLTTLLGAPFFLWLLLRDRGALAR